MPDAEALLSMESLPPQRVVELLAKYPDRLIYDPSMGVVKMTACTGTPEIVARFRLGSEQLVALAEIVPESAPAELVNSSFVESLALNSAR